MSKYAKITLLILGAMAVFMTMPVNAAAVRGKKSGHPYPLITETDGCPDFS